MYRTLDLFCGAGGLSSGFAREGFNIIGAMDSVSIYTETHKKNFPSSSVLCADISHMPPSEYARKTGIAKGDVEVVIGGPPCQTFSSIGLSKIRSVNSGGIEKDSRNYLFKHYLKYIEHYSPRLFLMENVPNLSTKFGGRLFEDILKIAGKMGYSVSYAVLNAVNYGVPQSRKRLFIVGTRTKSSFVFPLSTHVSEETLKSNSMHKLLPSITVREAIDDLPDIFDGIRAAALPYSKNSRLSPYQRLMRNADGTVSNNICRVSNSRAKKIFKHMKEGHKYMDLPPKVRKILPFREDIFHDRLKRLIYDAPSWTVIAHIGMDGYMYIHPSEDRTLSVREAARLQSFHDSFEFVGNMREQYIQVGNAVPPLLGQALACACTENLSQNENLRRVG